LSEGASWIVFDPIGDILSSALEWKAQKGKAMDYILEAKTPEVEQYLALRQSVGWHRLPADTVANSLSSSIFNVCAVHADEVIGFGRVVGDGYIYFYLQDIIVHPDWQGHGIGKAIIQHLYDKVLAVAVPGAFFGLMAANGASPLYEKFGFKPRSEKMPGMSLWFST
jgi:GNAT superfamily N-acetyltransferase